MLSFAPRGLKSTRSAAITLVACVAFVTLAATPSHAQALMKVNVPFSFSAGHGTLPAGEYSITEAGQNLGEAVLLSAGQRSVELVMPMTTDPRDHIKGTKLVFHRYGDEYFLAEIWTTADDCIRSLRVTKRERQMAKAGVSPEVAVVYGVQSSANAN